MEIHIANDRELDYIHSLYSRAFPLEERKPFQTILDLRSRGICDIWIIELEGERCGMATVCAVEDIALLDYFAIEDAFRGKGLGGAALDWLTEEYRSGSFFVEIERLDEKAENNAQRMARKRFYLQHGFVESGLFARMFGVGMEIMSHEKAIPWKQCRRCYRKVYRYRFRSVFRIRRIQ